ncbi:hypothetical protein QCM77_07260 [Bradyrhizobium sp. SSUT18]|uniref:hypothetical protein n=1 Tax=unclassified Bradyrhizobium TaxID=2631580 RepID=UPI00244B70B0|nr:MULTISPECIES: hypothetical protein [unclassified Bradyrhizobium]MDH2343340.1 hypothetical protein [Bradyrhizobium sp. SSUT77]MDH2355272.1 hypothetical protein [Bradyrhizobium sp. SSUT112]MDH2399744.1 hypothetical protein [Bradyrhizobium sp. SSUT18]
MTSADPARAAVRSLSYGCYAGSSGVESRLSIFNGSRYEPMTLEERGKHVQH